MVFGFTESPKIVVIGAGLAGLTAAHRLHEAGKDVEVYEARSRVGGRVFTVNIAGRPAELGAQNISDGGKAFHMHRLIDEFGLVVNHSQVKRSRCYFDGTTFVSLNDLLAAKHFDPNALKTKIEDLVAKSHNLKGVLDGILHESDPIYKITTARLTGYEGAPPSKVSTLYAETLYHMLLGGIAAVHQTNEEGAIALSSIEGGNALLPEKIASSLGSSLHLNMPLVAVAKEQNSYVLTFGNGKKVKTDLLILTVPCSVYADIAFEENVIPIDRLQAIQSIQYGMNAKILVPFSQEPVTKSGLLNDHMLSFFDIEKRLLTLYYLNEASLFSKKTIAERYKKERQMLEMGFGGACPPFVAPAFAEDKSFAAYDGPVGYSFPNDPFAKGTYAYITAGQEELCTRIEGECKTLFAPIDKKLYFAGEHASILLDTPGTMEAACESGERVARQILLR